MARRPEKEIDTMDEPTVLDRVRSMRALLDIIPSRAVAGSAFEQDEISTGIDVYQVAYSKLQESIVRMTAAMKIYSDLVQRPFGTHLIALRPSPFDCFCRERLVDFRVLGIDSSSTALLLPSRRRS